uniref:Uncharacterized protein n=1 Tax=Setaria italica TaxID=4555 RepID=K3Z1L9_SETIT
MQIKRISYALRSQFTNHASPTIDSLPYVQRILPTNGAESLEALGFKQRKDQC